MEFFKGLRVFKIQEGAILPCEVVHYQEDQNLIILDPDYVGIGYIRCDLREERLYASEEEAQSALRC